jgi:spore maturation protein SpmB
MSSIWCSLAMAAARGVPAQARNTGQLGNAIITFIGRAHVSVHALSRVPFGSQGIKKMRRYMSSMQLAPPQPDGGVERP